MEAAHSKASHCVQNDIKTRIGWHSHKAAQSFFWGRRHNRSKGLSLSSFLSALENDFEHQSLRNEIVYNNVVKWLQLASSTLQWQTLGRCGCQTRSFVMRRRDVSTTFWCPTCISEFSPMVMSYTASGKHFSFSIPLCLFSILDSIHVLSWFAVRFPSFERKLPSQKSLLKLHSRPKISKKKNIQMT